MEEGEFEFRMIEADENFKPLEGATAKITFNEESGAFEFDAVTFRAVGKYYFIITEENTENDKRVTYDDTVYHVTIEVTDDLNGNLVANDPIVLKANETEPSDGINFVNIFTPKPDDVTVDIEIVKTVVNKGTAEIGPEGFEFLLDDLADETDEMTAVTDEEGNAKFTLTFTEDDIGKTFNYKLTEIDGGKHGVEYSKAEYNIAIEITLDEETNTLAANIIQNDTETENVVAEFENIYEVDIPKPGDDTDLTLWMIMMLVSGAALTLFVRDKKRKTARDM
jgi:pilin isopeptide linkage protein